MTRLEMLNEVSDIIENSGLDLELEPHTDKDGVDWIYVKMKNCRSVRIRKNGYWEQLGYGRFGKALFKEAVLEVIHVFQGVMAKRKFIEDAKLGQCENRELINLSAAGWRESCPSENAWHFDHPEFPNIRVTWRHAKHASADSVEAH